jgi:hypothetical protein
MTSDLPPLSATHPTLYDKLISDEDIGFCGCIYSDKAEKTIQSCTVDKAEYERLKKELEKLNDAVTETWYNKGIAEGKRRTMQRVKEDIEKIPSNVYGDTDNVQWEYGYDAALKDLKEALDLSDKDDEQKTFCHYRCAKSDVDRPCYCPCHKHDEVRP